jgi:DNA-binding protein H-NS
MPKRRLETIQKRINALLSEANRLRKKRMPALRRIVGLAKGHGISIAEIRTALVGGPRRKTKTRKTKNRRTRKVAPKYRNPKTGETWSGRGRPARWLVAAEKEGRKRNEFLVKKESR